MPIKGAFYNCNNLTAVYYNGDIADWCNIKFKGNYSEQYSNPLKYAHNLYINNELVTEIEIPDTVTSIGQYQFYGWNGTSITLPASVASVGDDAFENCSKLTSVYYNGGIDDWCNIKFGGIYSNPLNEAHNLYINNELVTEIEIPDTVTSIGAYQFYGWNGTSITLPNTVTSIAAYVFSFFSKLTSVYYKGSISDWCNIKFTNAYSNPLYFAHNLYINNELVTEIEILDTVTSIGAYQFYGWNGTSVIIPDSVITIGNYAFHGCSKLKTIYYTGTEAQWSQILIGDSNSPLSSATIVYNYTPEDDADDDEPEFGHSLGF